MPSRNPRRKIEHPIHWSRNPILKGLFNPRKVISHVWRKFPLGSFSLRLACDAVPRPPYAYCMYEAALTAERLGLSRIAAIEFGVAGGNGLVAMEKIADEIENEVPIHIEIYGFDTGSGLPEPIDYRDVAYVYRKGDFKIDEEKLRKVLGRAQLVLGDVKDTVPAFFEKYLPAPIGFISFDLDYYHSTVDALKIFETAHENLLPRVFCYFDDIVGPDWELFNEWVGELLAIKEFNEKSAARKIAPIHCLRHKRIIPSQWNDQVYVLHDFEHQHYNSFTARTKKTFALRP